VFPSIVRDPGALVNGRRPEFRTDAHPVQSFLWSDYTAEPGQTYEFEIWPRYGTPGSLRTKPGDIVRLTVTMEAEEEPGGHSIWFNRGAIAGQYFADEFGNVRPTEQQLDDLTQPVTKWLSRGLAEAFIRFIDSVKPGEGLLLGVYEFHYAPVLNALKAAIDRGVLVQICYHRTPKNVKALDEAGIPEKRGRKQILFPRTIPKIPHNKFMVHVVDDNATRLFTGSTNITRSGFLGQSNVGHQIDIPMVAEAYRAYWENLKADPERAVSRRETKSLTPHPPECPEASGTTCFFSPRYRSTMLEWYANRMKDAQQNIMFTAAFTVSEKLMPAITEDRDVMRFVLMEKRPSEELFNASRSDRDLVLSYGEALGTTSHVVDGELKIRRIANFSLDEWFAKEEHYRRQGNVFYVHTKFLLIDALTDDPLVCTGSSNFSANSLLENDENMLLIRGNTRVADIYMTEFDRIFKHFYFRNVANEIEKRGQDATGAFLSEIGEGENAWHESYFTPGRFKTRRREMFFKSPQVAWSNKSLARPQDETSRIGDKPTRS
jgi:hypothetical protein